MVNIQGVAEDDVVLAALASVSDFGVVGESLTGDVAVAFDGSFSDVLRGVAEASAVTLGSTLFPEVTSTVLVGAGRMSGLAHRRWSGRVHCRPSSPSRPCRPAQ